MPNWRPSDEHLDRFKQSVNHLMQKRVSAMEAGFPLTLNDVKLVTTPPELEKLLKLGIDSLQTTNWICFELTPELGAARRSVVQVHFERPQHYAYRRQTQVRFSTSMFATDSPPIYFNNSLDADTHKKLVEWVDRSVFEHRLAKLVSNVVAEFLRHTPNISIYHMAVRWPVLKVVFPLCRKAYGTYGSPRNYEIWEKHGRELGSNLRRWDWPRYGPEADWRKLNERKMKLVEETILSCLSLPDSPSKPAFWAEIVGWESLNGLPF